jgi:superfamily II DNA or RNA helicase/dsRNA-specific ribonuclease
MSMNTHEQERHAEENPELNQEFLATMGRKLTQQLLERRNFLRSNQIRSFQRLIQFVNEGKSKGLVKQPPAAGKTRLFAEVLDALKRPSLIFVPRTSLRQQSKREMVETGIPEEEIFVLEPQLNIPVHEQLEQITSHIQTHKLESWNLIMTYQSLLRIYNKTPELFAQLMDEVDVIISDEAHRSLGSKTKGVLLEGEKGLDKEIIGIMCEYLEGHKEELLQEIEPRLNKEGLTSSQARKIGFECLYKRVLRMLSSDIIQENAKENLQARMRGVQRQIFVLFCNNESPANPSHNDPEEVPDVIENEQSAQDVIDGLHAFLEQASAQFINMILDDSVRPHLHLRLTATPQLGYKRVEEEFNLETIDWIRIQDLINDGILVMPSYISAGKATYRTDEDTPKMTTALLRKLCEEERFIMEDGRSVIEAVTEKYLQERARCDGYLPAVAFCETIDQAERVRLYMESKGLKVVRCTSQNAALDMGMDPEQVKQLLERDATDPERVDIVTTVSRIGEGWDVRTLRAALWFTIVHSPARSLQSNGRIMRSLTEEDTWPEKLSDNTFIIEPEWRVLRQRQSMPTLEEEHEKQQKAPAKELTRPASQEEIYIAANAIETMVALGEIDASLILRKGIPLRKLAFDVHNDDHLKLVIGSIDALIENGLPRDLQKITFSQDALRWKVRGVRIASNLFPKASTGRTASSLLARRIWSEEAEQKIFEPSRDDHLRILLRSPTHFIRNNRLIPANLYKEFVHPERNWKIDGQWLTKTLFGSESIGLKEIEQLMDRLWPIIAEDRGLDYENQQHMQALIGSEEHLNEDCLGKVFINEEKKWRVSGRRLLEKYAGLLQPGEDLTSFLKTRLFSDKKDTKKPAQEPQYTQNRNYNLDRVDPEIHSSMPTEDYISHMYRLCQAHPRFPKPAFRLISTEGPKHALILTVECTAFSLKARAKGPSKKIASQYAARLILQSFEELLKSSQNTTGTPEASYEIGKEMPEKNYIEMLYTRCQKDLRFSPALLSFQEFPHPTNNKVFIATCRLGDKVCQALGKNAKIAKQLAAKAMLETLPPFDSSQERVAPERQTIADPEAHYMQLAQSNPKKALKKFCEDFIGKSPLIEGVPARLEDTNERTYKIRIAVEFGTEVRERTENVRKCREVGPTQNRLARELLQEFINEGVHTRKSSS